MRPGHKEYLVWREDDDREDAAVVEAFDHEDAAEEWADDHDPYGDYTISQGVSERVFVALNEPDSPAKLHEVWGECVRQYSACFIGYEK